MQLLKEISKKKVFEIRTEPIGISFSCSYLIYPFIKVQPLLAVRCKCLLFDLISALDRWGKNQCIDVSETYS